MGRFRAKTQTAGVIRKRFVPSLLFLSIAALVVNGQTVAASTEAGSCQARRVSGLPGSGQFGSEFIEAIASDPAPRARDANVIWGLTADLSEAVPAAERALYISKSTDGGLTWRQVSRLDSRYFNAGIGEGLRNGLAVTPGGADFVVTTQLGAFQVLPGPDSAEPVVRPIAGPRVPHPASWLNLPKTEGDPIRAGSLQIMPNGRHMIVGFGYFDLNPQLFAYHKDKGGAWVKDGPLPHLPTEMDILSMQLAGPLGKGWLYVGTGDQAYRLDLGTKRWTRIAGVGDDSAIHGMSLVGGLHLAACWGVYNPVSADEVMRLTEASFLLHRGEDEIGPEIRAYSIDVDPARHDREVITAITGVYTSPDGGKTWRRLNALPEGEFRTAHFNADGSILVSGVEGTFLVDPFSKACLPGLKRRAE
ncbi:hypothetical protein ACPOL_0079 [Acidisarcina polymorpha]|uniref:Glycosyl hydrolase, BNR repeat n=1 Tax=Acidisarcina polymorpha TaxID=2211140 RepID=A0A2Z5FSM2_9BACT|nr:hypothetical protein [Acidisarcina polymorpha]AXC09466.1 hypothetical protein ACPOL_0079 [Acidisarcina polymorpha]